VDRGNEKTGKDKGRGRIGERGRNGEGKGEEGEEEKARGQTANSCSEGKPCVWGTWGTNIHDFVVNLHVSAWLVAQKYEKKRMSGGLGAPQFMILS
jgi:hypothetical protein